MTKINPNKFYNLTELLEFIPWIHSIPTMAKWVEADMAAENYLKAIKVGSGSGTRYHIKGEFIINFLVNVNENGLDLSQSREEVNKMESDDETMETTGSDADEANTAVEEAQADEAANGVDHSEETLEDEEDQN